MKAYTNLEQSKRLAEFLPLESADMWYPSSEDGDEIECGFDATRRLLYVNYGDGLPCWSLAALLELIPNYVINKADDKIYANLYYGFKSSHDNLVDAAFEMILELHEQKLL